MIVQQQVRGLCFTMLPAGDALAGVVSCFFELHGTPTYGTHRLLARPGQQVHLNLGDPVEGLNGATGSTARMARHLVSGARSGWFDSRPLGHVHFVGIDFAPMGLHALLGIPQDELAGRDLPLDDVLPTMQVELLREQLAGAKNAHARLTLLQHTLLHLLHHRGRTADNAATVAHYAMQHCHQPMRDLEQRTGFSRQYLLKLLRARTGLSLQEHKRLQRMNKAVDLLARSHADLADVALDAGFYDQPHFSRQFKQHTGLTPAAYLRADREMGEPYFA